MAVSVATAQSLSIYQYITGCEYRPLIRNPRFRRGILIGLIGDRGAGKSLGAGVLATRNNLMRLEPCWSNMDISTAVKVDDENTITKYENKLGLKIKPGYATYQSQPLDLAELLSISPDERIKYHNGVIVVDEINIALADARRSMTNQNLAADDIGQQLRKLGSDFIYTCIHELFVDVRIRDITDFFIMSKDAAFIDDGKPRNEGEYFHWKIYPMTDKAAAIVNTYKKYSDGGTVLDWELYGRKWWGCIDTLQRQERKKITLGKNGKAEISIGENKVIQQYKQDFGWMDKIAKAITDDDRPFIPAYEYYNNPDVLAHQIAKNTLSAILRDTYGIPNIEKRIDGRRCTVYVRPEKSKLGYLNEAQERANNVVGVGATA